MLPRDLPNHYFPSVRARDIDGFISLFAEDATMILPDDRTIGAPAIREMDCAVSLPVRQCLLRLRSSQTRISVAVEIEVRLPNGQPPKVCEFLPPRLLRDVSSVECSRKKQFKIGRPAPERCAR